MVFGFWFSRHHRRCRYRTRLVRWIMYEAQVQVKRTKSSFFSYLVSNSHNMQFPNRLLFLRRHLFPGSIFPLFEMDTTINCFPFRELRIPKALKSVSFLTQPLPLLVLSQGVGYGTTISRGLELTRCCGLQLQPNCTWQKSTRLAPTTVNGRLQIPSKA